MYCLLKQTMKIILTNFRCYKGQHTLDIEDTGITLINGPSGAGKSTIMMALHFVITGIAPSKVITDGETSCKVELQYGTDTIVRTKRPNRVVVNSSNLKGPLEDDQAQHYINNIWGKHFDITSYIQQQYQKTFLYQSPTEKLEILEQLCFDNDDIKPEELKKKCNLLYKKLSADHSFLFGKLDSLLRITSDNVVSEPTFVSKPDEHERTCLQEQLQMIKIQERQYFENITTLSKIEDTKKQLESLRRTWEQFEPILYTRKELEHEIFVHKQLELLPPTVAVWERYSKQDCEEFIKDYERDIGYHKEYEENHKKSLDLPNIKNDLQKLHASKEHLLAQSEGNYTCPKCDTRVSLVNEQLICTDFPSVESIDTKSKKEKISKLDQEIIQLSKRLATVQSYQTRCVELEEFIDPTEDTNKLLADYKWIYDYYKTSIQTDVQNATHEKQRNKLTVKLDRAESERLLNIVKQKDTIEDRIKECEHVLIKLMNVNKDVQDVQDVREQRKKLEQDIQEYDEHKHMYDIYSIRLVQYQEYLSRIQEQQQIQQQLKTIESQMTSLLEFKQLILKTETDIIAQKMSLISDLVNGYIAQIFSEPITIELQMSKKTQTQQEKIQIQLEVYYKNMKCDISILSGGEQARLNLAFILAFAHVFQSPLLLLDECTSNLDADLTELVIDQIESMNITKVIMIAHQVVEGNFKQILNIS